MSYKITIPYRTGNKIEHYPLNSGFMLKWITACLFISVAGCNSSDTGQNFSTVDSNIAGNPDSVPRRLHLDSFHKDTKIRVALDSPGPTINPRDTAY